MARPPKQGLDYFPLDVVLDDKFKFIEIKYGMEGFGIVIKLMQKIYLQGYWCFFGEDETILFAGENRINEETLNKVLVECLKRGIFNQDLFEKYSILTSKGIQKRFYEVAIRRKTVDIVSEYVVYDDLNEVNVNINSVNVTSCKHKPRSSEVCDDTSTQRKGKKSKEEKSKELKHIVVDVIDYLNSKADKQFKSSTKTTQNHIKARVKEGFTKEDMIEVVDKKVAEWGSDPKMMEYLRPQTLFGTKFESYLNAKVNKQISREEYNKKLLEGLDD